MRCIAATEAAGGNPTPLRAPAKPGPTGEDRALGFSVNTRGASRRHTQVRQRLHRAQRPRGRCGPTGRRLDRVGLNSRQDPFAVSSRCRHQLADLSQGVGGRGRLPGLSLTRREFVALLPVPVRDPLRHARSNVASPARPSPMVLGHAERAVAGSTSARPVGLWINARGDPEVDSQRHASAGRPAGWPIATVAAMSSNRSSRPPGCGRSRL